MPPTACRLHSGAAPVPENVCRCYSDGPCPQRASEVCRSDFPAHVDRRRHYGRALLLVVGMGRGGKEQTADRLGIDAAHTIDDRLHSSASVWRIKTLYSPQRHPKRGEPSKLGCPCAVLAGAMSLATLQLSIAAGPVIIALHGDADKRFSSGNAGGSG